MCRLYTSISCSTKSSSGSARARKTQPSTSSNNNSTVTPKKRRHESPKNDEVNERVTRQKKNQSSGDTTRTDRIIVSVTRRRTHKDAVKLKEINEGVILCISLLHCIFFSRYRRKESTRGDAGEEKATKGRPRSCGDVQ